MTQKRKESAEGRDIACCVLRVWKGGFYGAEINSKNSFCDGAEKAAFSTITKGPWILNEAGEMVLSFWKNKKRVNPPVGYKIRTGLWFNGGSSLIVPS